MEFFSKVFTWFANLSAKLPQIDYKSYFIVVLVTIAVAGIIIAFTYFDSRAYRLKRACKKIITYLSKVESIDDDNLADFINQCITAKIPASLRDSWLEYLNVRFGFPSEFVSDKNVYDKEVKTAKGVRPKLFLAIGLIILAIFAFWGFGTLDGIGMSVIHFFGLVLVAVVYLLLVLFNKRIEKDTYEVFYQMQEELDVKVDLQVEKNYATDSSPLSELATMVDEIIARNTAKIVDITEEMNSKDDETIQSTLEQHETPIETLIAIEEAIENKNNVEVKEEDTQPVQVSIDDIKPIESVQEDQPMVDNPTDETIKETVKEETLVEENHDEVVQESTEEQPKEEKKEIIEPIIDDIIKVMVADKVQSFNDNKNSEVEPAQQISPTEEVEPLQNDDNPMSMYQDLIPVASQSKKEKLAPKKGMRIGKKVGLASLDVEDVLMGSDFSEVEGEEEDEEDEEPLQEEIVVKKEKKTTKKSNKKQNKKSV